MLKNCKKGFTLLELLVVVLTIGILASIALPQYQMAVTKAKVASILPLMRRWKDALAEYKLQHGDYGNNTDGWPDGATLGVNWPSDWKNEDGDPCDDSTKCKNDYWLSCGTSLSGIVYCGSKNNFSIYMYQPDYDNEDLRDKITCYSYDSEGMKICKAIGSKLLYDDEGEVEYQLY